MAAPPSLIHLAFASGLDESQEDELLDPMAGFPVLQNGRQDKRGGYSKRLGYTLLGNTYIDDAERTAGRRLFMNGQQLCCITGTEVDVYSETLARLINKGRVPEAAVTVGELPTMGASYSGAEDTVEVNGYVVVSYTVAGTAGRVRHYVAAVDKETGAVVSAPFPLFSGAVVATRLANYGSYAVAFTADSSTYEIYAQYMDFTSAATISLGWQTAATLIDFGNVGFDVAIMASDDRVAVAYGTQSDAKAKITITTLDIGGILETVDVATAAPMVSTNGVGLSEGGDTLWITWVDTLDVKVRGLDPSDIDGTPLASTLTAFTMAATVSVAIGAYVESRDAAGTAAVFVGVLDGTSVSWRHYARGVQTVAGAAATDGILNEMGGAMMTSRPFLRDGRFYAHVTSPNQDDGVLCDITPNVTLINAVTYCRPVAAPLQRGLFTNTFGRRGRSVAVDANRYVFSLTVRKSGSTYGNALATYDFASVRRWKPAPLGGSVYLSGGVTSVFDGSRVCEASFLVAPSTPTFNNTGGSGLSLTNGRRYVVTYEEIDADGNWSVSGVSPPCALSGAQSNKACVVSVAPLSITARGGSLAGLTALRAVVYATLDANFGLEPYHRLGAIENDSNATLISYSDTTTDADLATGALLYSTGNLPATGASQDHRAPPGLEHIVAYNGMLVGSYGRSIFYSSQPIDGEGPWFSPVFVQSVDEPITGLAVQDGALLVFTRNGAWTASGDPPSDNAAQGGLSVPRKLAIELGCVNANSIVSTSIGTFYESERGIEILNRSGGVEWVGEKVHRTLAAFPVITSAVMDTRNSLVRFSLAEAISVGAVSGDGRDLIFDMSLRTWISVDDKAGQVAHEASQDAAFLYALGAWRYGWLGADGIVHYERDADDAAANYDGEAWVTLAAETAWFKASGVQGRQVLSKILLLARKSTDHDLSVSLSYNYEQTFRDARTWSWSEIDALLTAGWPITQLKHDAHDDGECQAFRVRIEDSESSSGEEGPSPTTGTGQGAKWLALTLDVTPKPGAFEVPEEAA